MVWDIGTYEIVEGSYGSGNIRFSLQGRRIAGEWTLTREGGPTSWLITKRERAQGARGAPRRRVGAELLAAVLAESADPIRCSETLAGMRSQLLKLAQGEGLEGLVANARSRRSWSGITRATGRPGDRHLSLCQPSGAEERTARPRSDSGGDAGMSLAEDEAVAQVAFADWTDANHLRHARFVGLRDDKNAREVVQERAA